MHFGRQKANPGSRHTTVAVQALQDIVEYGKDEQLLETILISFESKLSSSDDYTYLLRELGNRGDYLKAIKCFEFAVKRERRKTEQGKLASAIISTLGRLGQVDLANNIFETAFNQGYGNTVYAFSALISAYGKSGFGDQALRVFESMRYYGLKPNLVTYNAVIDACGKSGIDYNKVVEVFDDMSRNGVQPDRITFNSLLAVCSRARLWKEATDVFTEMVKKGIDQDIFTYNTLLDAICKGGQMDIASQIMSEMPAKNIKPNVVTYSTMIDGYAKSNKLNEALSLFEEMNAMGIEFDRVLYNTKVSIYSRLGRFDKALDACEEMESSGISNDVVTYNALLDGYGKHSQFDEVRRVLEEMKSKRISLNVVTYSTLMDAYLKGGLYTEALQVFRQLNLAGLKADVVFYSSLIDSLCKNRMVQSAFDVLDEMTKKGVSPNATTYNSIIDAFGRSAAEYAIETYYREQMQIDSSALVISEDDSEIETTALEDDYRIVEIVGQLENTGHAKKDCDLRKEMMCILGVVHKMHELNIKRNVVTFSAILNACSTLSTCASLRESCKAKTKQAGETASTTFLFIVRCNSFEDASMLLEELRLFDNNQVYGVAHGLLMGCTENVWLQAQSLFHEIHQMDHSDSSAFYNALTDLLWHFGQKRGAQLVVLEGKRRRAWENVWTDSCLDLHLMSSGAARAMVHEWLLNIRTVVFEGQELPKLLSILTGWGKHSKVVGDSSLRRAVGTLLAGLGAPFKIAKYNLGRFISPGSVVAAWLKESGTLKLLVLHDDRTNLERLRFDQTSNLQMNPV
ncbi:hypothetical protein ACFE04_019039 [Oxalis oulophora]